MANTNLKIITPQGIAFQADIDIVTVQTVSGYIGLQAGRTPLVSALEISVMHIGFQNSDSSKKCVINGGIVYATSTSIEIITDQALFKKDVNFAHAKKLLNDAENKLSSSSNKAEIFQAAINKKMANAQIELIGENQ